LEITKGSLAACLIPNCVASFLKGAKEEQSRHEWLFIVTYPRYSRLTGIQDFAFWNMNCQNTRLNFEKPFVLIYPGPS
jgi:hypothetical protein